MPGVIKKQNFPQVTELAKKLEESRYVIGVDLHEKTTAITIFDKKTGKDEPVFQRKRLKNELVIEILDKFEGEKFVVAEAAYNWRMMRDALENRKDTTFVIFDARKTSAWTQASGIKSDGIDATVLAYTCLSGGLPRLAVYQPDKKSEERFRWINFRDKLVESRTRIKNQLKSIDRDYGKNPFTGKHKTKPKLIRYMEDCCLDELNLFEDKIEIADEEIKEINREDPVVAVLTSIPGIGPLTGFALRFKVDKLNRFSDAKHFASYFGFGIRQSQSGESMFKGRITRTGNSLVRKYLVQGAHVIKQSHPEYIRLYFPDLSKQIDLNKKTPNKLIIAVARKILTFAYYCWKNGTMFSMEDYKEMREKQIIKKMVVDPKAVEPGLSSCSL